MTNQAINTAIETAKAKAANHPEWLRAITKAGAMLQSGELCVTLFADNTALITSPNGSYKVNGTCPCAARTSHCYHRAAKRLVEMAETAPTTTSSAPESAIALDGPLHIVVPAPDDFAADVAASSRENLLVEIP